MIGRRGLLIGATVAPVLAGCDQATSIASRLLGADLPERLHLAASERVSPARRLLERAAFGPWPGQVERVEAEGTDAWIERQLRPEEIDDAACEVRAGFVDVAHVPADLVFEMRPEHLERQLTTHTLLKAVYSERQLLEVMVELWSDHFNVHIGKDHCRHLTALHVRDTLRANALGRFRDLLRTVVLSPAMLVYLDGRENAVSEPGDVPNENYARELLELHALGVHGGYTQRDVMEAARCLTGWVVLEEGAPGAVRFDPSRHDDGAKTVLGRTIPAGGGEADVDRLLDVVVAHPSCAEHVATRLCRYFVADEPPAALVSAAARVFRERDGRIDAVLRTILRSDALASAPPKVSRPFRHVVRTLRALGADTHARGDLHAHLERMGQRPYDFPTPDGYPLEGDAWLATLLPRWRFALALTQGELDDTSVDLPRLRDAFGDGDPVALAFRHLVGRDARPAERAPIDHYLASGGERARALALVLSSPAYLRS